MVCQTLVTKSDLGSIYIEIICQEKTIKECFKKDKNCCISSSKVYCSWVTSIFSAWFQKQLLTFPAKRVDFLNVSKRSGKFA